MREFLKSLENGYRAVCRVCQYVHMKNTFHAVGIQIANSGKAAVSALFFGQVIHWRKSKAPPLERCEPHFAMDVNDLKSTIGSFCAALCHPLDCSTGPSLQKIQAFCARNLPGYTKDKFLAKIILQLTSTIVSGQGTLKSQNYHDKLRIKEWSLLIRRINHVKKPTAYDSTQRSIVRPLLSRPR